MLCGIRARAPRKGEAGVMGDVVELDVVTSLDLPPERILNKALEKDLAGVIVVGTDKDGEFYFASSYAAGPEVLWLLEGAKMKLLKIGFDHD
jgi:hypothetical protein